MNVKNGTVAHIQKVSSLAGSENHLCTLLPLQKERGYDPHMIILHQAGDDITPFTDKLNKSGIPIHIVPIRGHKDPGVLIKLTSLLRRNRFAVAHTHLLHGDLYGSAAAKLAGTPTILSTRHNDDPFRRQFIYNHLIRLTTRISRRVICISHNLATFGETVEKTPKGKITTIHYGLDDSRVVHDESWRKNKGIPDNAFVVGIVARLTEQKGHTTLIKALAPVMKEYDHCRFVVIGEGELKDELISLTAGLGMSERTHFLGYLPTAPGMMKGFDLFAHPSRWEGFGLVFLEAMSAGLPVVATRTGAVPEIVLHGKTGLLMDVDDVEALRSNILQFIENPDLGPRFGAQGKRRLQTDFSVRTMADKTCRVYEELQQG